MRWNLAADRTSVEGGFARACVRCRLDDGAYADGDVLLAVNRPEAEDRPDLLADERVTELFEGLDFTRIDHVTTRQRSLVEELWRRFLIAMMAVLLAEAWLCLPRRLAGWASRVSRIAERPSFV